MKKTILSLLGLMFIAGSVVHAQIDSTNTIGTQQGATTPTNSAVTMQPGQVDSYTKDMTFVKPEDVPADLQKTLRHKYKGSENAKVYRIAGKDSFVVKVNKDGGVQHHKFDGNGKPLKDM